MTAEIYIEEATATGDAPEASLEELLAFERLLACLSSRFANVSGDKLETEIESALRRLLHFLDFDRGNFGEFTADGWATILCSATTDRVEPYPARPGAGFFELVSWPASCGKNFARSIARCSSAGGGRTASRP